MLPIPSEKVIAGHQMTNKELNFIRPGITTKEEVVERLDDPDMIWQEERIFAYNWQTTWGVLLWVVAAGYGYGDYGADDIGQKNYVLLIRFDPNDRVERFEATKRSKSDSYGEHLKKWIKKIKNTPATEVPL